MGENEAILRNIQHIYLKKHLKIFRGKSLFLPESKLLPSKLIIRIIQNFIHVSVKFLFIHLSIL